MADRPLGEVIEELTETIKRLESKQAKAKPGKTFGDVMSGVNVETFFPSILSPIGRGGQNVANLIQGTINQFRGRRLSSARSQLEELQSQMGSEESESESASEPVSPTSQSSSFEPISPILENIEHIVHDSYNCLLDIKKILGDGLKLDTKENKENKVKERADERKDSKESRIKLEKSREASRGGFASSMKNMGIASLGAAAEVTGGGGMGGMVTSILGTLSMSAILPIITTIGGAILTALGAIISTVGLPVILGIAGLITAIIVFKDEILGVLKYIGDIARQIFGWLIKDEEAPPVVKSLQQFVQDTAEAGGRAMMLGLDQGIFGPVNAESLITGPRGSRREQLVMDESSRLERASGGAPNEIQNASSEQEKFRILLNQFEKAMPIVGGRGTAIDEIKDLPLPERREAFRLMREEDFRTFRNIAIEDETLRPLLSQVGSLRELEQKAGKTKTSPSDSNVSPPAKPTNRPPATIEPPAGNNSPAGGSDNTANSDVASASGKPNIFQTINNIENIFQSSPLLQGTQLV